MVKGGCRICQWVKWNWRSPGEVEMGWRKHTANWCKRSKRVGIDTSGGCMTIDYLLARGRWCCVKMRLLAAWRLLTRVGHIFDRVSRFRGRVSGPSFLLVQRTSFDRKHMIKTELVRLSKSESSKIFSILGVSFPPHPVYLFHQAQEHGQLNPPKAINTKVCRQNDVKEEESNTIVQQEKPPKPEKRPQWLYHN